MSGRRIPWLLELAAFPFVAVVAAFVVVPCWVATSWWRWHRAGAKVHDRVTRQRRDQAVAAWQAIDAATRAELLAHGLMDTPENRARLRSSRRRA